MHQTLYFPKRIPEPKKMEKEEMLVFEQLSQTNYKRWVLPLVKDASRYLTKKPAKILDVGCGPGLLAKGFAEEKPNCEIFGLDISPHALNLAKKNCRGLNNTHFVQASIYRLPFPSQSFELVVCKDTFHHFDHPRIALREMLRVLKTGGTLYIQDLRRDLPMYLLKRSIPSDTPVKKLQLYSARAAYTKEEIAKILKTINTVVMEQGLHESKYFKFAGSSASGRDKMDLSTFTVLAILASSTMAQNSSVVPM